MSNWVGTEIQQSGSITSCSGCTWLTSNVASTNLVPVFYAYFIGYLGHANGFPDQNTTGGASLASGGAYVIRKYRSQLIAAYAYYAQEGARRLADQAARLAAGGRLRPVHRQHAGQLPERLGEQPRARPAPPSRRSPTPSSASWRPTSPARSSRTCRTRWWPSTTRPGTPTTSPHSFWGAMSGRELRHGLDHAAPPTSRTGSSPAARPPPATTARPRPTPTCTA